MRVLQLIDSLNPGGAERMAVTLANALVDEVDRSFLCTTREEGALKENLRPEVGYCFLEKRSTLDIRALWKLRRFVRKNNIGIVHAHSTSYFFATLLKIGFPKLELVWHEHWGDRISTKGNENNVLYLCSHFFNKIIVVNDGLLVWAKKNLATKCLMYLPNFVDTENFVSETHERKKTIVCVSNLRPPKNHLNLLEAFVKVHLRHPNWNLELLGKDGHDSYSQEINDFIVKNEIEDNVKILGSVPNVADFLCKARIGIISSDSEGLPMALLEYGAAGLAVVCTNVGDCAKVLDSNGLVVPPNNANALAKGLLSYIENKELLLEHSKNFRKRIRDHYSPSALLPKLLNFYNN